MNNVTAEDGRPGPEETNTEPYFTIGRACRTCLCTNWSALCSLPDEKKKKIFSFHIFRLFMYVRWIPDEKFYCTTLLALPFQESGGGEIMKTIALHNFRIQIHSM